MFFIPKNPLSLPEIEHTPSTPSGTRGIFAKNDGLYEIDALGKVSKITNDDSAINSLKYYGKTDVVPSPPETFAFKVISEDDKTARVSKKNDDISGDIVIPYECKINNKLYKVVEISESAFTGSPYIKSVTIPSSVKKLGYLSISQCPLLKKVEIPDSVTYVDSYAFAGNSVLTDITIPYGETTIRSGAFTQCISLKNIKIHDRITTIGNDAFAGCESLTSVKFGRLVENIGHYSFNNCASLSSVTIPVSVKTIGQTVFSGCSALADVWYEGTKEQWDAITIEENNEDLLNATIHYNSVPSTQGYVDEAVKNLGAIKSSVHILGGVQNWTIENITDANGSIIGSRYVQAVNVNNAVITPNSKVDLQIDSEQMVVFYEKRLAFVAENDNGAVTVSCVGDVPEDDYTIQAVVTEVVDNG